MRCRHWRLAVGQPVQVEVRTADEELLEVHIAAVVLLAAVGMMSRQIVRAIRCFRPGRDEERRVVADRPHLVLAERDKTQLQLHHC